MKKNTPAQPAKEEAPNSVTIDNASIEQLKAAAYDLRKDITFKSTILQQIEEKLAEKEKE